MFVLQKIIARVFFPLPIVFWLAVAAGIAAWRGRRRLSRRLAVGAVVWLFLISWNPVGDTLLGILESRYPPLPDVPPGVTHIVVLGGGAHAEEDRHSTVGLSRSSQGRVLEGVRLWRAAASSRASGIPILIFTGDSADGRRSMASLAAATAFDLGIPPGYIVALEETLNTRAEAHAVARYLEGGSDQPDQLDLFDQREPAGRQLILVTSASHLPRAAALFRRAGLDPIPAPAQYLTDPGGWTAWSYLPDAHALAKTERFVYEVLGLIWMRVRG